MKINRLDGIEPENIDFGRSYKRNLENMKYMPVYGNTLDTIFLTNKNRLVIDTKYTNGKIHEKTQTLYDRNNNLIRMVRKFFNNKGIKSHIDYII
jgi:hypothetical protein